MKRKNVVVSLIFPVLTFLPAAVFSVLGICYGGYAFMYNLLMLATTVFGGIVPIALTVRHKIDTSQYIGYRVVFMIIMPILIVYLGSLFSMDSQEAFLWTLILMVMHGGCFWLMTRDREETIVLSLSNPAFVFMLVLTEFAVEWNS